MSQLFWSKSLNAVDKFIGQMPNMGKSRPPNTFLRRKMHKKGVFGDPTGKLTDPCLTGPILLREVRGQPNFKGVEREEEEN